MINIIERCRASPPPSTAPELSLPLTFFDVARLDFHEIQRILFYKSPLTTSSFVEAIIPQHKSSLALALKHYLPFAGNFVYPLEDSDVPTLRYVDGDSIPLTFAESSDDFGHLAGNQARKCDEFYPLIPELPQAYSTSTSKIIPLFAVQVTVFPNSSIAVGSTNLHVIGDANVIVRFTKAWASINKFGGDTQLQASNLLPFYERSVIKYPYILSTAIFSHLNERSLPWQPSLSSCQVSKVPENKVRSTFFFRHPKIQELKNYVLEKRPGLIHAVGEMAASDEEADFFLFSIDCRSRLDTPIPAWYFGNCLIGCFATSAHAKLVGKDQFVDGAELIGEAMHKKVNDMEGLLNGSGLFDLDEINWNRVLGVTGTPKNDIYDVDFGWGRPEKYESISIDRDGAMSLNKLGREEGGLEVGLSMPQNYTQAFASIFTSGLCNF